VAGGIVALLVGLLAAPAAAKPFEKGHFHDVGSEVNTDCGLTLLEEFDVRGNFVFNAHGPDGLLYSVETVHGTDTLTNPLNGKSFTQVFNTVNKDLKVTDNGDGTLTILVLSTGSLKVYGPDGTLLFNEPGQVRFELLIDHNGTPTDPTDDAEPVFLGIVKGSTGRNDTEGHDFCTDVVNAIG
jgi:hypothetical protein